MSQDNSYLFCDITEDKRDDMLEEAAGIIKNSRHTCAFTGAGVSTESGIPPFRGKDGLWSKFDPIFLDIDYFHKNPEKSWKLIKQIFYDFFGNALPNPAHFGIAKLEEAGCIKAVITQNIDNLHQLAGSANVIEFHGTSQYLVCENCRNRIAVNSRILEDIPPKCPKCGTVLKPDFVFFGEPIPEDANRRSFKEAEISDVFLVIGTTGEIQPASMVPYIAKDNGAKIIEINTERSNYTDTIADVFLQGRASDIINRLKLLTRVT